MIRRQLGLGPRERLLGPNGGPSREEVSPRLWCASECIRLQGYGDDVVWKAAPPKGTDKQTDLSLKHYHARRESFKARRDALII